MNESERINEVIRRLVNFYNFETKSILEKEHEIIILFMQGEASGYIHALNIIAEEFEIDIKEIYKMIKINEKEGK